MILNDFELVVRKLPTEQKLVNIYPIGDLHVGSGLFDIYAFDKWKAMVKADPNAKIVIIGDMTENGLKNSKTDSYQAKLSPFEQKVFLVDEFGELRDKILCGVQGNHELRSKYSADICPMYEFMSKLDVEDKYRENIGFIKVSVGKKNTERQFSYGLTLSHGGSDAKVEKFAYSIDGIDAFISGHTHKPSSSFPAKIVLDMHNEVVRRVGFTRIVVPSMTNFGGYIARGLYLPQDCKFPILTLSGERKGVEVRWV